MLQDEKGITPLGVAVGFNRLKAIGVLLEAHADVERTDRQGNTPLHYAAGEAFGAQVQPWSACT